MSIKWPYKWGKRFNDNLSPKKDDRGFDGIPDGVGAYDARMKERWGCLASRIAEHGCFPRSCYPFPFSPTLSAPWLAWNKNPQCPPDIWENISVSLVPMSGKPLKGLAVQRHSKVKNTLDNINHIELSFSINNDIDLGYGFWLIKDECENFVYAILKSSMFRAWCELTAYTDKWTDKKGHKHQGAGHFAVGMWDTFPIQDIENHLSELGNLSPEIEALFPDNPTVEEAIRRAGQWLKNGWTQSVSFDECMDELCGFGRIPKDYLRKQILAEGFLDAFYGA